jgi:hypothetical protein
MAEKMKIITSYKDAYELALPYINAMENNNKNEYVKELFKMQNEPAPKHATSSRWLITKETLHNTLQYIFEGLAHNCYMLCVGPNEKVMCKIECLETPERFESAVKAHLKKLPSNKLITGEQRDKIRRLAKNPVRIMQCIVKPIKGSESESDMNEYYELIKDLTLPQGVFILNLTDAVILRRNNYEPFPMVTGDKKMPLNFCHIHHLPIMSLSGEKKYSDIPFPNYDDVFIVMGKDMKFEDNIVNWDDKKINKAVFRGGPSGCGYTTKTNQRLKLVSIESPLLDAKVVGKGETIDSNSIKFDPVYGLGMLNTGMKPGNFMKMSEQSNYKYIVHVDGNVNAYRLLTTMMTGSLILRVDSPYVSWVDHLMQPGKHYIMVKSDLSDLVKIIKWCEKHPERAREIAEAGYQFAKKALTREFVEKSIEKIFWSLPLMSKQSRIKTEKHLAKAVRNKTRRLKSALLSPLKPRSPLESPLLSPLLTPLESPLLTPLESPLKPPSPLESPPPSPLLKPLKPPSPLESPPPSPLLKPLESPLLKPLESPLLKPLLKPSPAEVIDMPPGKKKCPTGYSVFTDTDGVKKCTRKAARCPKGRNKKTGECEPNK